MSSDEMLTILYEKCFSEKRLAESLSSSQGENNDRLRQVAIEKNKLLSELIDIRTRQIREGKD